MRIDFSQRLKSIDGSELTENGKPLTLGVIAVNALLEVVPKNEDPTADVKVQRWKIAQRVAGADGDVDITVEEIVLVKRLIGVAYGPLVVGQAFEMLERSA
jgi:hypothetical protein